MTNEEITRLIERIEKLERVVRESIEVNPTSIAPYMRSLCETYGVADLAALNPEANE